MNKRLKQARKSLHLSLDYVARYMGMTPTDVTAVEDGRRQVTDEELARFSQLYSMTPSMLQYGDTTGEQALAALGSPFTELSGSDREAVISLLHLRQNVRKAG